MRREDGEMDKALLRNIPKVDELLAPTHALCPDASSAAVTATPMISNRIPIKMMAIRTINATAVLDFLNRISEKVLIKTDSKNAKIVMKITHLRRILSGSLSFFPLIILSSLTFHK